MLTRCPHCSKAIKNLAQSIWTRFAQLPCVSEIAYRHVADRPAPTDCCAAVPYDCLLRILLRFARFSLRYVAEFCGCEMVVFKSGGFCRTSKESKPSDNDRKPNKIDWSRRSGRLNAKKSTTREAERKRKHRQWLTTLHREMASVPTVQRWRLPRFQ